MKFAKQRPMSRRQNASQRRSVDSRLRVESLEGRVVLSASIDFSIRDAVVRIMGTEGNDSVVVEQRGQNLAITLSTPEGEITRSVAARAVRAIRFDALGGDDRFTNTTATRSVALGGPGSDALRGGSGPDSLFGGPDDDTILGGLGDDQLRGDAGDDDIDGGFGSDAIRGGEGNDIARGGFGRDRIWGDGDDDWLDGEDGVDSLVGGAGLDYEDDFNDRFADGDRDRDGYDDDHDRPVDPGLLAPVVFDAAGVTRLTGTSLGEHDRSFYSFTAAADQTLTVTLQPDATGRYAELELRDATARRELLDLEPRENGRVTGQVVLRAGNTYLIRVHADSRLPLDYTVDLSLSDAPPMVTPPAIGGEIVFDEAGNAQVTGTSLNDDDKRFYSFTAAQSGVLTVQLLPGADGRYAELELKDVATRRELLELEPRERPWQTSGRVSVVAGRTYVIKVESSSDRLPSEFTVNLSIA
ncbi:MAG: hypothetical protein ACKOCX_12595 [Planctomycetota bacterium]